VELAHRVRKGQFSFGSGASIDCLFWKAKILVPFLNQRLADYAELTRLDLITFRNEMSASIVGAAIGAAALLFLLGFICVALVIGEWDTPHRMLTAWLIVIGWALITVACAYIGRSLMKSPSAFQNIASAISLDLSAMNASTSHLMTHSLVPLLEKMRASRDALTLQLEQLRARKMTIAPSAHKVLTPKHLGITIGVLLAMAALSPARRRR
jgi:hypothetical protein